MGVATVVMEKHEGAGFCEALEGACHLNLDCPTWVQESHKGPSHAGGQE